MPLKEITGGGDRDDDAGTRGITRPRQTRSLTASAAARPSSVSSSRRGRCLGRRSYWLR
jgi:hypothetical protein